MDREIKRKIWHAATAILAVPLLLIFPLWLGLLLALAALCVIWLVWRLERRGQRMRGAAGQGQELVARALEHALRPHEDFPWASVYFIAGLLVVAGLTEILTVPLSLAFAAYAFLGVGDTASALIGKAYGTLRIPWNRAKTWEGTGAGVATAYPWALMLAAFYYLAIGGAVPSAIYWVLAVGVVVAMLVETLPGEDNFMIPVSSWGAMLLVGPATGAL